MAADQRERGEQPGGPVGRRGAQALIPGAYCASGSAESARPGCSPSAGCRPAPPGRWIIAATVAMRLKSRAPTSCQALAMPNKKKPRSEEHTSELQSHVNLVCRLLLEKKKKN